MFTTSTPPRMLTAEELAATVKLMREMKHWSQQQLAEISGLSVRTIQRVENAHGSDFDTRRALGRAFEFEDIDAFNKPFSIPDAEEAGKMLEKFEREHVTLKALPVASGRALAGLAEVASADLCSPGFEMGSEAQQTFALLVDYVRDYRDCHDLYSEVQKLEVHEELQGYIDALAKCGVTLRHALRHVALKAKTTEAQPLKFTVLYLHAFPAGQEPEQFMTARELKL